MKEKNTVFYRCSICNNLIGLIQGEADKINCCGQKMERLVANEDENKSKKHIPIYERVEDEIFVKVGESIHPMEKDHYIEWIAQVSDNQTTRIRLYPEQNPEVRFKYIPGAIIYAYCTKDGLWKTEVK